MARRLAVARNLRKSTRDCDLSVACVLLHYAYLIRAVPNSPLNHVINISETCSFSSLNLISKHIVTPTGT